MRTQNSIALIMGREEMMSVLQGSLVIFKIQKPWSVKLDIVTAADLGKMMCRLVYAGGYQLRDHEAEHEGPVVDGAALEKRMMAVATDIVRQTHDASIIKERNAYLASDMYQRAISRKNDRIDLRAGLVLSAVDFGVEMESKELIQQRRDKIESEVADKVGWSEGASGGPKGFFNKIKGAMFAMKGGNADDLNKNWNVVVTGNPGTGPFFCYPFLSISGHLCFVRTPSTHGLFDFHLSSKIIPIVIPI